MLLFLAIAADEAAAASLNDGEYSARAQALRTDNDNKSTVDERLIPEAKLDVAGSAIAVTLKTTEPLTDLSVVNGDGTLQPAQAVGENTYLFTIPNSAGDVDNPALTVVMQITVATPMGTMTPQFRLVVDELVKTENGTENGDETDNDSGDEDLSDNDEDNETDSENQPPGNNQEQTDNDDIREGKYTIAVKALKIDSDEASIVDSKLLNPAIWEFTDGNIFAYVTMSEALNDVKVANAAGEFVSAEVIGGTTYRFEIVDADEPAIMQIFVPGPDLTVQFRLVFDQSTLQKLDGDAEVTPVPPADPQEPEQPISTGSENNNGTSSSGSKTVVANPKTADSFSLVSIVLAFLLLSAATSFHAKKQA